MAQNSVALLRDKAVLKGCEVGEISNGAEMATTNWLELRDIEQYPDRYWIGP